MLMTRDPFAREEVHRTRQYYPGYLVPDCSWCGGHKNTPSGRPFIYRYWYETDGGSHWEIAGNFCSQDCFKTYHERGRD
jgi:hypothetical protein